MSLIITYLLNIIQYQYKQICWLTLFIAKYIPLKQWAFDDSHSPKYQKFKTDILPVIIHYEIVDYNLLIQYYKELVLCQEKVQIKNDFLTYFTSR